MNIKNLVTPTLCFAFIVVPSALSALIGMLLIGFTIFDKWDMVFFIFGLSVLIVSVCMINFWVKSFISEPSKKLSQLTQVVLILTSIIFLTFSIVQGIEGNIFASVIGLSYVLVIAGMSLNYFYHRAQV